MRGNNWIQVLNFELLSAIEQRIEQDEAKDEIMDPEYAQLGSIAGH